MRKSTEWITVAIKATREVAPGIREFTLEPGGGAGAYPTGSHLQVQAVIEGKSAIRHYSLIGDAPRDGTWRIAVKREDTGRGGSRYMWSLPAGARLQVTNPDSQFQLSRDASEYLLIAGGIGITPILGMAMALKRRAGRFHVLYLGRSRTALAYLDELHALLGNDLHVFTDDEGRADVAAEIARLDPEGEAYICGPLGLLEAVRRAWQHSGRRRDRLHYETFGSSGRFATEPFTVCVPRLGVTVEVPAGTTMLDALEAAGVRVLSDCRRGECGLCQMEVLELSGSLDHRDVFFSDAEHASNHRICACVSRVSGGTIAVEPAWRGDERLLSGSELRASRLVACAAPA
ncbi:PDR/VanB family oxidoreductase [Xanthobacter autotrophicus]|uniref:PDR/VanB family oxidoreductase n=1 Tax=Xanthobacter autotrophicus TaxID=280 RepID=UPI0024A65ADC|nr:PDR/VanB family oxidoreductase [Xanthobacter autotrophicus]MDI4655116.1 PDR/VanB family oxidoreductase [Xanthobacter autotrophicus]